jgi:hypothetical protein
MKYYRARIKFGQYGSKFKKKQYEKTIWVRASDEEAMCQVLTVIKKIPFGRLISAKAIDRDDYLRGVSRSHA